MTQMVTFNLEDDPRTVIPVSEHGYQIACPELARILRYNSRTYQSHPAAEGPSQRAARYVELTQPTLGDTP